MRFSERRYCGILIRAACVPACAVIDDSAEDYAPGMLSYASGLPLQHTHIIAQTVWICKAYKHANIGRFQDFSKDGVCDIISKYRGRIRAAFPGIRLGLLRNGQALFLCKCLRLYFFGGGVVWV